MRIDSHVHYTPPALLRELSSREPYWSLLLGAEAAAPDPARMLDDMDRAGLDRVVLMGNYWRTHEMCVANNDALLDVARRRPGRIIPFASIQPTAGAAALDELARCLDGGMRGVGELGAYGQGYTFDDPDFRRLVEACIINDVPLNLHVSEPVGHFYPGKSTTPLADYYHLAVRYPELKLILAHWGGGLPLYELMPEARRALYSVYYDTAASPLLYPTAQIFPAALAWLEPRKILYGSDYPLPICRKAQSGPDFRPFLQEIADLGLSPAVEGAILGDNAAQLLGLIPTADAAPHSSGITAPPRVITEIGPAANLRIDPQMAAGSVARAWPATRAVFERHGIPWDDSPVPYWEPIGQSAAARGLDAAAQQRLLDELNATRPG